MTVFSVFMMLAGVLNLIMGIIIITSRSKSKGLLEFSLFSFVTFIWAMCNVFIYTLQNPIFVNMSYAVGAIIPMFLIAWICKFSYEKAERRVRYSAYAIGAILCVLSFFEGVIVSNVRYSEAGGLDNSDGFLSFLYIGFYVFAYVFTMYRLTVLYRRSTSWNVKSQTKIILLGFSIYGFSGILFSLILPVFGYDALADLDVPNTLIFVSFTTYAIVQYKWMDIKIVAMQILVAIMVFLSFFEITTANTLGQRLYKILVFIIFSIIAILLVRSVRKEIQRKEELQHMADKLVEANGRLKKLDQAKSEFISIASHQLRTPLTAVKGFISLIMEGTYGLVVNDVQTVLNKVYIANEHLIKLVEDLLSISRIESGKMKYQLQKCDFSEMAKDVTDMFIIKAKEKNLDLHFESASGIQQIIMDSGKIREVVTNLVDNAIKYTNEGFVKVSVQASSYGIRLTVSDSGVGINPNDLPFLFEKFSRGNDTAKTHVEGTGLGLYVAKNLVEAHGGRIWIESAGVGKGSTFFVELPFHPPASLGSAEG